LRDVAYATLGAVPGVCMACTIRLSREQIGQAISGALDLREWLKRDYPFIIRPLGSHAGKGLERVSNEEELGCYLERSAHEEFYLAPFIDYSSADGLFCKYRIVMIDGEPFMCHMGISKHWMVHYPYEEMLADANRREEEARTMARFDTEFVVHHRDALRQIAELTGLEYMGFDCAETQDGRLLIFEIATGMIVHDMDDPQHFPYKAPQIRRIAHAFEQMLRRASRAR